MTATSSVKFGTYWGWYLSEVPANLQVRGTHPFTASTAGNVSASSALPSSSAPSPATVAPAVAHVFVKSHEQKDGVNTVASSPVETYVIIGRGFAAITNHVTLLKADSDRARYFRAAKRVIHIGYPDPWSGYVEHNMNQAPETNTPPGYDLDAPLRPYPAHRDRPDERWLRSKAFAKATDDCFKSLTAFWKKLHVDLEVIDGAVDEIVKRTATDGKQPAVPRDCYEVVLADGRRIRADRVDVCSGVGQQTLIKSTQEQKDKYAIDMPAELWKDYLNPPAMDARSAESRRVWAAEMYVRATSKVTKGGSVLVTGASPASIQAMEHALDEDGPSGDGSKAAREVVMLNSASMNGGFLPIGRLDYHARSGPNKDPLPKRLIVPEGKLYPARDRVWFLEGFRIQSIEMLAATDKVLVLFKKEEPAPRDPVRLADRAQEYDPTQGESKITCGVFDQVVIGSGRNRGASKDRSGTRARELGSALDMVRGLDSELTVIRAPGYAFAVGVQNGNASVRLLGASGLNNPVQKNFDKSLGGEALDTYEQSLPIEARVNGEGVGFSAVNIARANDYFTMRQVSTGEEREKYKAEINSNVNTANLDELMKAGVTEKLAKDVYYARAFRIRPFINLKQLGRVVEIYRKRLASSDAEYRKAREDISNKQYDLKLLMDNAVFRQKKTHLEPVLAPYKEKRRNSSDAEEIKLLDATIQLFEDSMNKEDILTAREEKPWTEKVEQTWKAICKPPAFAKVPALEVETSGKLKTLSFKYYDQVSNASIDAFVQKKKLEKEIKELEEKAKKAQSAARDFVGWMNADDILSLEDEPWLTKIRDQFSDWEPVLTDSETTQLGRLKFVYDKRPFPETS